MPAKALVIAGYGLNCEEESAFAFSRAGCDAEIVHINDLIDAPAKLDEAQILCIPGGFSYGDDTGSGNAFAQKIRLTLMERLGRFVERDTLAIGICNGCQVLVNLGLVPAIDKEYGTRQVAVTHNASARYQCRWTDLAVQKTDSPWLKEIDRLHIPVAHGEGRFLMDDAVLKTLQKKHQVALRYVTPDGKKAEGTFPYNPSGTTDDIGALTDPTGRVLAIMPHPERGMLTPQRDDYARLKDAAKRKRETLPEDTDGMAVFRNAARYFG